MLRAGCHACAPPASPPVPWSSAVAAVAAADWGKLAHARCRAARLAARCVHTSSRSAASTDSQRVAKPRSSIARLSSASVVATNGELCSQQHLARQAGKQHRPSAVPPSPAFAPSRAEPYGLVQHAAAPHVANEGLVRSHQGRERGVGVAGGRGAVGVQGLHDGRGAPPGQRPLHHVVQQVGLQPVDQLEQLHAERQQPGRHVRAPSSIPAGGAVSASAGARAAAPSAWPATYCRTSDADRCGRSGTTASRCCWTSTSASSSWTTLPRRAC